MQTETEGMKFCKDCKYAEILPRNGEYLSEEYICNHPEVSNQINLVTGEQRVKSCIDARYDGYPRCGVEAKYFEPKEVVIPWYRKLFRKE